MISDIQHELKGDLNNCKYFFLFCLDETTAVTSSTRWLSLLDFPMVRQQEEQVKLETLPTSTSESKICNFALKMLHRLTCLNGGEKGWIYEAVYGSY